MNGNRKNVVRLTESKLRNMIKEAVVNCIDEAYNQLQYANLAGQADGALNTLGGKIKGIFNPQWKQRKQRQRKKFADAATSGDSYYDYHIASNKGQGIETSARASMSPTHDYDRYHHKFNQNDKDKPFDMQRSQWNKVGNFDFQNGPHHGDITNRRDLRDQYSKWYDQNKNSGRYSFNDYDKDDNFVNTNTNLNQAFNVGRDAARGKMKPTNKNYGTGTQNGRFKRDGEGNRYNRY